MAQGRSRVWRRVLRRYSSRDAEIQDLVQTYRHLKAEKTLRKATRAEGLVTATSQGSGGGGANGGGGGGGGTRGGPGQGSGSGSGSGPGSGASVALSSHGESGGGGRGRGRTRAKAGKESVGVVERLRGLLRATWRGLVRVRNSEEFHVIWKSLLLASSLLVLWSSYRWWRSIQRRRQRKLFLESQREGEDVYDVVVVGGGPAGSVCAYYLAAGGLRVALVEKQRYPHDRVCGDIVAPPAHPILAEMGVLQELLRDGIGKWLTSAGNVSPSGVNYIADVVTGQDMAVQRIVLDHRLATAAYMQGADVVNLEVTGLVQEAGTGTNGYWSVQCKRSTEECHSPGQEPSPLNAALQAKHADVEERVLRCRMVVAADGPMSRLAQSQGLVEGPPNAVCLRSFAKPGTHCCQADFIIFHPLQLRPGFLVVTREVEDYLSVCCFVMPGGKTEMSDIYNTYTDLLENDPHIKAVLGPDVVFTPIQSAPMRLACLPRLYRDQFLVVGEAAGHVDPMAGQGIQYAMIGAKLAARTIREAFDSGDISARALKKYQQRVDREFGWDMWMASKLLGRVLHRFPMVLDAMAAVVKRNGDELIRLWRTTRSGTMSKLFFLRPDILFMLAVEFVYLFLYGKLSALARGTRVQAEQRIASMLPPATAPVRRREAAAGNDLPVPSAVPGLAPSSSPPRMDERSPLHR